MKRRNSKSYDCKMFITMKKASCPLVQRTDPAFLTSCDLIRDKNFQTQAKYFAAAVFVAFQTEDGFYVPGMKVYRCKNQLKKKIQKYLGINSKFG